jgi:hypothetical protein
MSLTERFSMLNRNPDTQAMVELASSETSSPPRLAANFLARPALDFRYRPACAASLFCGTHSTLSSSSGVKPS